MRLHVGTRRAGKGLVKRIAGLVGKSSNADRAEQRQAAVLSKEC